MIPILISEKTLNDWQIIINKFLWNDKRTPRIRFKVLQNEKKRDGLAINIKLYSQNAGLIWISDWTKNSNGRLIKLES